MKLFIITALIAVCGADKLDRTYLPPPSAKTAGGSSAELQAPRISLNNGLGGLPKGSFENEFEGVVVDAAAAGTRASEPGDTGLGAPRIFYGSTDSKVGAAAFKTQPSAFSAHQDGIAQFQEAQGFNSQSFSGPQGFQAPQGFSSNVGSSQSFGSPQQGFSNQGFQASHGFANPERERASPDRHASVLRYENEVGPETYHFAFETDNGIAAEENGVATNGVQSQGGFSYTADDGQVYSVSYTADEGGYQPRGDHLPTPPPIPEEILKSLEQNAKDEAAGVVDDGSYDAQKYNAGNDYSDSENAYGKYKSSKLGGDADATSSGTFIHQNQAFRNPAIGQNGLTKQGPSVGHNGQAANTFSAQGTLSAESNVAPNEQTTNGLNAPTVSSSGQFTGHSGQSLNSYNAQSAQSPNRFSAQTGQSNKFNENLQQSVHSGSFGGQVPSTQFGQASTTSTGDHGNNFGSYSSTLTQSLSQGQSRPSGNRNDNLHPNKSNGSPENGLPQIGKLQNGKPQTSAAVNSPDQDSDNDEEGSGNSVPLGQQNLQSGDSAKQAVNSFGKPAFNTNGVASQNAFSSSSVQNRPSNVQTPTYNQRVSNNNGFAQLQSSPSGNANKPNEYLPPKLGTQSLTPSKKPQVTSQFSQQYNSNADDSIETAQTQDQSQTTFPTSPSFSTRPPQTNAFQRSSSSITGQNRNNIQSQPQTQFISGSAQSSFGFNSQKSTAQPATELTTPIEPSNKDAQSTGLPTSSSSSHPTNNRPTQPAFGAQYNNAQSGFVSQSQPQVSRSFGQTQVPAFSTQPSFVQSSQFGSRPQSFAPNSDAQFAASTQRPSYTQQPQGPDDSYIYDQPARTFSTPQFTRFPSAPSGQFNRVTQQSQKQISSSPQDVSSATISSSHPVDSTKYPRPPTIVPTGSSSQSQGSFEVQTNIRGTTKYSGSQTIPSSSPTVSSQFQYQSNVNGVTQAAISPFPSQPPTQSSQYSAPSQFGSRPNNQQSKYSQTSQLSSSPLTQQPTQPSFSQKTTVFGHSRRPSSFQTQTQAFELPKQQTDINIEPSVSTQQYNGEIYEYTKPAQTLPPPDSTPASSVSTTTSQFSLSRPQFGQTNDHEDQRPTSQFGGSRPQFSPQSKPQTRPQFGQITQSQSSFGSQTPQTKEDNKPYGALAQSQFGSQISKQPGRPQFGQPRPQYNQNTHEPEDTREPLNDKPVSEIEPSEAEVTPSQPTKTQFSFGLNTGTNKPVPSQPQIGSQFSQSQSHFGPQSQFNQNRPKPLGLKPACCQDDAGARKPGQIQSQFGQTSFSGQKQPTNSFAGRGEVFGGPRQQPSFDEKTGYHY